jgi:hypothetical protein
LGAGHLFLALARKMRHDADHAFGDHQLAAMVHFVLFWREQHFEARASGGLGAGMHSNALGQKRFR